jgi:phage tail-like protein
MATLPIQINDGNYEFLTGQYFTIELQNPGDLPDGIGRAVFTECTGLKFTREPREHFESGSSEANISGDKRTYENITLKRGYSYDPASGQTHDHLEKWWQLGKKVNLILSIFDDQEGDGTQRDPRKQYLIKGAMPVSFVPWEGNATSGDTTIQELEIKPEKVNPIEA